MGEGTVIESFSFFDSDLANTAPRFFKKTVCDSPSPVGRERAGVRVGLINILALLFFLASALACFGQSQIIITNLAEQRKLGREFVQELLSLRPETNSSVSGVIKVRNSSSKQREIPVRFQNLLTGTNWVSIFEKFPGSNAPGPNKLIIAHDTPQSNRYELTLNVGGEPVRQWTKQKSEIILQLPFAGDFGTADLGLEFLHWPEQRMIKKEMARSQFCKVIESINPQPATNAYSKVISWIQHEGGGIVYAEAFDAKGAKLKEFRPKSLEKVHGQYQLREMEMLNVQTGSRTRIEFDLEK